MADFTPFLEEAQRVEEEEQRTAHTPEIDAGSIHCSGTVSVKCFDPSCGIWASWCCEGNSSLEARGHGWRTDLKGRWLCPDHAAAAGLTGIEAPF